MKKLSSTIDFLTASDGLSGSTKSSPPHVPQSPNRFELLQSLDNSVEQSNSPDSPNSRTQLASDSNLSYCFPHTEHQIQLTPSSPFSKPSPHYPPKSQQPHGITQNISSSQSLKASSPVQMKVKTFLHNVPSQLSTLDVQTT